MTGMRQGELLALRWQDVDWTASKIRIRQNYVRGQFGTPKTRRSTRSVPMGDRLAGELDRHFQRSSYKADEELVFANPDSGEPLGRTKLVKRYKEALRRAKVREIRFHDLRHSFGTTMASHGVPMKALQEWLGHRDSRTTDRYADYSPGQREAEFTQGRINKPNRTEPLRKAPVQIQSPRLTRASRIAMQGGANPHRKRVPTRMGAHGGAHDRRNSDAPERRSRMHGGS
jgi:integrase